jgi:hypothetical protein
VIAVTGLEGHAFGSWRSPETHLMWLQDFLPKDVKNVRIMAYGCNRSLRYGEGDMGLSINTGNFIEQLENSGCLAEVC